MIRMDGVLNCMSGGMEALMEDVLVLDEAEINRVAETVECRPLFKANRAAVLAEWRGLCAT